MSNSGTRQVLLRMELAGDVARAEAEAATPAWWGLDLGACVSDYTHSTC